MGDAAEVFALVFVAELGDKSMLLAIALAARFRPVTVLAGIAIAACTMLGAAALTGGMLGAALPERALTVAGGVLFLGFGLWTLRVGEDGDTRHDELDSGSVLLGVTLSFLVAEFGDKTMLATVTLASTRAPIWTWLASSLGMVAATGIAIAITTVLGSRLPQRTTRRVAAGAFLLFGVLLLAEGIIG